MQLATCRLSCSQGSAAMEQNRHATIWAGCSQSRMTQIMFMVSFLRKRLQVFACLIGALLFICNGCIFRRITFSNASTLLKIRIDSAFNLTPEQTDYVEKKLQTFLTELNKNELRQLQVLVSDAGKQIEKRTTQAEISQLFERWNDIYGSAVHRAAPAVGNFLAQLKQEQIEQFELFLNQRNQKKLERISEGEPKFREKRIKTVSKQISEWLGPLTKVQILAVENFAKHEFKRSQQEQTASFQSKAIFLKALLEKKSADFLSALFIGQQAFPYTNLTPMHTQIKNERRKAWTSLISNIVSTVTPDQISRFKKETDSLALDLQLIGEEDNSK